MWFYHIFLHSDTSNLLFLDVRDKEYYNLSVSKDE